MTGLTNGHTSRTIAVAVDRVTNKSDSGDGDEVELRKNNGR